MAKLKFHKATMRAGKSTLALQINDNFKIVDKIGLLFTMGDRSGESKITSRIGIEHEAILLDKDTNIFHFVKEAQDKIYLDYLIFDEVQFYTKEQIEQLADIVDELEIDVFCFGLVTDFRGNLFEGSKRLIELSDEVREIEVKALCWCGRKGLFNSRVSDGYMVTAGEQEVVGEGYEVLCREHFNKGITKKVAEEEEII